MQTHCGRDFFCFFFGGLGGGFLEGGEGVDAADLFLDLEDMLMDVLWCEFLMVTEEVFQQFGGNCGSSKKKR